MTEKITTAEELDALPVGSVVLDRDNTAWQKVEGGAWVAPDDLDEGWPSEDLSEERPRFLYRPDAPAPSAEDREALVSDITLLLEAARNRCSCCAEADGELTDAANRLRTTLTSPAFTPAQRHAAEQDPALFRVATRAQFGTGEVIDMVLRALGADPVECEPTVSGDLRMALFDVLDQYGPDDLGHGDTWALADRLAARVREVTP